MLDAKANPASNLRTPDWYKSATRWTQLTLVEDDPIRFDPAFWIDVFKRTRSNATCLSAGGYIAYYPSAVPLHYVSKHLKGRDIFGELVAGARDLGMHVMARVDPHAIHQATADAHPEWIQRMADGSPRRHWSYPSVWITCALGGYNRDFMPKVVREICERYDIDAIFANREEVCKQLAAAQRENEGLRKDAERYRWLRDDSASARIETPTVEVPDNESDGYGGSKFIFGEELDAAIDAALASHGKTAGGEG